MPCCQRSSDGPITPLGLVENARGAYAAGAWRLAEIGSNLYGNDLPNAVATATLRLGETEIRNPCSDHAPVNVLNRKLFAVQWRPVVMGIITYSVSRTVPSLDGHFPNAAVGHRLLNSGN